MKTLLRIFILYTLILFFLLQIIPGFAIVGGFHTIFVASFVLMLFFLILKPILTVISFPVNMITLGIFNIFVNGLLIYLMTVFVTDISISPFTYDRATVFGFITPAITFNTFFAYLYVAFVFSLIDGFIKWLMN